MPKKDSKEILNCNLLYIKYLRKNRVHSQATKCQLIHISVYNIVSTLNDILSHNLVISKSNLIFSMPHKVLTGIHEDHFAFFRQRDLILVWDIEGISVFFSGLCSVHKATNYQKRTQIARMR